MTEGQKEGRNYRITEGHCRLTKAPRLKNENWPYRKKLLKHVDVRYSHSFNRFRIVKEIKQELSPLLKTFFRTQKKLRSLFSSCVKYD